MGMTSGLLSRSAVERLERIVAIELLCACQALDCDRARPAAAVAAAHAMVRELVPTLDEDRPPAPDIEAVTGLLRDGAVGELLQEADVSEVAA